MQAFSQISKLFRDENSRREERLILAAQRGDDRAFEELLKTNEEALRRYVASRVGREMVDDIVQETRVAAWITLRSFSGRSRLKAWLLGIAYHKCQDYHRGRMGHRRGEVTLDEALFDLPDPRDPFTATETKLLARSVMEALPDAQREVMELYYYGGLTLLEVASVLGRAVNTVKSQFYRAHARALEILRPTVVEVPVEAPAEVGFVWIRENLAP